MGYALFHIETFLFIADHWVAAIDELGIVPFEAINGFGN